MAVTDGISVAQLVFCKVLSDLRRNIGRKQQPVLPGDASLLDEAGGQCIGKVRAGHPNDEPLATPGASETQVQLPVRPTASTTALDERDLHGGTKRAQGR